MPLQLDKFYINGQWVTPVDPQTPHTLINPATEQPIGQLAMGGVADAEAAIKAAAAAFPAFSQTSREKRLAYLDKIIAIYKRRFEEIAQAITQEMGSPISFSRQSQTQVGLSHFEVARDVLAKYEFETPLGNGIVRKEPIGVCGLITPWNWPANQVVLKIAPAIATGCTMVLKPSEFSPLTALIIAEIMDEAGLPAGVFNLVNGHGETVGATLSSHPLVDMVSITGSTRAGIAVAQSAAPTIKRVTQELGGKSANIVLDDAEFEKAVTTAISQCFVNCGQSCSAATRLLVPASRIKGANRIAEEAANNLKMGDPTAETTDLGPVVSQIQWDRIQKLITKGIEEGATLVMGGAGKPDGLQTGYYVKPTIFSDVKPDSTIAQEEIFGPVLVIIPYEGDDEAVAIANNSKYGLSGYVWGSLHHAEAIARRMRTGTVNINGAKPELTLPFGGYKQSGNGREKGHYGFEEYLEIKTITRP
ncbi:MAG: aldehyde dehydrogenase family protein [Pseudomonas fluorescens]|nr:MAG: aldehyde dehydrogenase family protein [Pseudomonas fluorescens]